MHIFTSVKSYYILYLQNFKAKNYHFGRNKKNVNYNPLNFKS
ncbi:hypothetical protein J2W48_002849 [Flavobacterium piscis]|uniref:Uncharacterized protein n=1 Tax=Flavobacterium piscis TaxID=1114874 RepID=A0ABU1Y9S1_9FLAO|nr:hypothetical protein [Flavobacterium piscis]